MPRIAVDSTGRSVAGVLELLKTTIAHKIADQLIRTWRLQESIRCGYFTLGRLDRPHVGIFLVAIRAIVRSLLTESVASGGW